MELWESDGLRIWVGRKWDANESIVLTDRGVSNPRSIRKMPLEQRWDSKMVQSITFQLWGDNEADDDAPPISKSRIPRPASSSSGMSRIQD